MEEDSLIITGGVLLTGFVLFIIVYLLYASSLRNYTNVAFANVMPTSATVVWVSPTKETGIALAFQDEAPNYQVGKFGEGIVGYDDRDYSKAELDAAKRTANKVESKGEDINASDNVTRWDTSRAKYDGLQKSEGELYGFDFPIFEQSAYFVRIVSGSGRWTPESEVE